MIINSLLLAVSSQDISKVKYVCFSASDFIGCTKHYKRSEQLSLPSIPFNNRNTFYELKSYGPLELIPELYFSRDNISIVPAKNSSGKKLYLAIDCSKNLINVTGKGNKWKEWLPISYNFENEIAIDICNIN